MALLYSSRSEASLSSNSKGDDVTSSATKVDHGDQPIPHTGYPTSAADSIQEASQPAAQEEEEPPQPILKEDLQELDIGQVDQQAEGDTDDGNGSPGSPARDFSPLNYLRPENDAYKKSTIYDQSERSRPGSAVSTGTLSPSSLKGAAIHRTLPHNTTTNTSLGAFTADGSIASEVGNQQNSSFGHGETERQNVDSVDSNSLNPARALSDLGRTVTAAQRSVFLAQRLAVLGQLSTVVGLLVVQEEDERKAIETAREVVVSEFRPLDSFRMERNKVEVLEEDSRSKVLHDEFISHTQLLTLERTTWTKLAFELQKNLRQECKVLDAKATFGCLRISQAFLHSLVQLKQRESSEREESEGVAKGRRTVETMERDARQAFADNWHVRFSQLFRRFSSGLAELKEIQVEYEIAVERQTREQEKQRLEDIRLQAIQAMEDRKRLEREGVEHAEGVARRTVVTTEKTTYDDIIKLFKFQAVNLV